MIKFFADGVLLIILAVSAVAAVLWVLREKPKLSKLVPYVLMAGLTSLLVGKLFSFWQPSSARPFELLGREAGAVFMNNPGFPSDHALLATVVVVTVFMLTPYKKLSIGLALLVVAMSIARVLALVHTPLDVVGGIVAGLAGVVWFVHYKRLET